MKIFSVIFLIYSLGTAGVCAAAPVPEAAHNSPLLIMETDFDFGEQAETEPFSHDFIVRNGGNAVLHINDVRPG